MSIERGSIHSLRRMVLTFLPTVRRRQHRLDLADESTSPKVVCKKSEDITIGGPRPAVGYKPKLAGSVIWQQARLLPLVEAAAKHSQRGAQATAHAPEDTESDDERLVFCQP